MVTPKLGLSMLYCLGETFQKMTDRLIETTTQYIEIVDDGFHELNRQRVDVLKEIGVSQGLKYSVHAPFADVNIASPSSSLRRAMMRRLQRSIMHAQALDAYVWVFHPGTKTGISSFYPGVDWLQNLNSVQSLAKVAEESGVTIAIENVPEPYPGLMKSVKDFEEFYAQFRGDMGMVLDVGHSNVNGQTESFIRAFSDKIVHIHLSDNDGSGDQHLGIGQGTIDWGRLAALMREISYDKAAVVESVERVDESLLKLKRLFV
jgi:sugar phosphate isomerase/epimerase